MKKNGFTLVELMAVLILLAILIGVSVNGIINARDKANKTLEDSADAPIIAAARKYVSDGPKKDDYIAGINESCVAVTVLINEGFLEEPIIENNSNLNDKVKGKSVKIELDSNYNYTYTVHNNADCS